MLGGRSSAVTENMQVSSAKPGAHIMMETIMANILANLL
jgi:hypothetical protein